MKIKTVDIHEAQNNLRDLLLLLNEGIEIILIEGETPLGRLVSMSSSSLDTPKSTITTPRIAGLNPGAIRMSDDFDEPLPDEFWIGDL